jgi:RNA polymerase sigma-70 factor (ECF subfamily)
MMKPVPQTNSADSSGRVDEFVRLLAQNQRRLFLYVHTLVPNHTDAEEVLQNTNLVLWREFGSFEIGTNFAAWACRVALNQVLAWRKKRQRDRLQFSDEFLGVIATEAAEANDLLEERRRVLAGCLSKLPADQRELIRLRYTEEGSIETVAQKARRTVEATYRALSRIRHTLHECVSRTLAREGRS